MMFFVTSITKKRFIKKKTFKVVGKAQNLSK